MPALNPAQLQVGQRYTRVNRQNPHRRGTAAYLGVNAQGWPQFNAGHRARASNNPAIHDFYLEGNANIPPLQNPAAAPAAPAPGPVAGPMNMNLERGRRKRRASRRKSKKSRKARKSRKH